MEPATSATDGTVVPADGALGRGKAISETEGATPSAVVGLSDVTQLSVGPNLGTCARTSDGSVYCWGRNDSGQLGRPPSEAQLSTPRRVEGIPPVDEVQLGFETGCAIGTADRALYCWGRTINGLGIEQTGTWTFAPQLVPTFRPPVKELAIGTWTDRDTIIALLDGGVLANIGEVLVGETSIPSWSLSSPVELAGVQHIGAFTYVGNDALLRRWAPSSTNAAILAQAAGLKGPVFLPTMDPVVEAKISAANITDQSRKTTDALRLADNQGGVLLSTGRLFRWGLNTAGTLGVHPDELAGLRAPLEIDQVKGEVVSFAIAVSSTCASLVSGKVKCWGSNRYGELGRGAVDGNAHPNAVEIR